MHELIILPTGLCFFVRNLFVLVVLSSVCFLCLMMGWTLSKQEYYMYSMFYSLCQEKSLFMRFSIQTINFQKE